MSNENYGLGRFICEHPIITFFVVQGLIETIGKTLSYQAYTSACKKASIVVAPPNGYMKSSVTTYNDDEVDDENDDLDDDCEGEND